MLIAARADVHARDKMQRTAVHAAASHGSPAMLELLLKAGARLDDVDAEGHTALHTAAAYGQMDAIQFLLAAGACLAQQVRSYAQGP